MFSNLHIDWLSLTIPGFEGVGNKKAGDIRYWNDILGEHMTCDASKWRVAKPMFGYAEAYQSERGTIAMYGTEGMGMHIIYSAQALYALGTAGIYPERIIKNALRNGAKATRADIALDIFDGEASVNSFERCVRARKCRTSSKSWRVLESGDGGHTLYIGSRSSERMVRIYDKKAERAASFVEVGSDSWIRAEVELKGQQAENFMKACKDNDINNVLIGFLTATVDFPTIPDWKAATNTIGAKVEPTETKRKDTKTRHWLMKTVAPVIAREVSQDPEFYASLLTEVNALVERLLGKKDN